MMAELSISALLIRFVLGGSAVVLATIVAKIVGQKAGGIFAAFPAVMITAVLMVGFSSGSKNAANVARGSIYGMIGCVVCVATVWTSLTITNKWGFSIILGLLLWLASSVIISSVREKLNGFTIKRQSKLEPVQQGRKKSVS